MKGGFVAVQLPMDSRVRVDDLPYRFRGVEGNGAVFALLAEDGTEQTTCISRAEFYAKLSDGTATLYDPLLDLDRANGSPPVTLAFLNTASRLDWYESMIVRRGLMSVSRQSPRSAAYKRAYADAVRFLEWVRSHKGVSGRKVWSAKTTNNHLRKWRHRGGAFSALLVQVVPARRKKPGDVVSGANRELVQRITRELPNASISTVHRVARAALRSKRSPPSDDAGSK